MNTADIAGTLEALQNIDPAWLADSQINSYDDFLKKIYEELDYAIHVLSQNPELEKNSLLQSDSEDRTTIDLVNSLKCVFRRHGAFHISHDTKIGGHADIVIEHNRFMWLGEAKIFRSSYVWLYKGLLQLVTRYSTGDEFNQEGAILIYIKNDKTSEVMDSWKGKLVEWSNDGRTRFKYSFKDCARMKRAFYSIEEHPRSGEVFYVRHIPVSLQFSPLDNAGLSKKN